MDKIELNFLNKNNEKKFRKISALGRAGHEYTVFGRWFALGEPNYFLIFFIFILLFCLIPITYARVYSITLRASVLDGNKVIYCDSNTDSSNKYTWEKNSIKIGSNEPILNANFIDSDKIKCSVESLGETKEIEMSYLDIKNSKSPLTGFAISKIPKVEFNFFAIGLIFLVGLFILNVYLKFHKPQ